MDTKNKSEELLKRHSIRVTSMRKEILNIFLEYDKALSHNDIELELEDCDRITLYRNLKNFQEKGIIHKAIDGTNTPKYALCEQQCDEHHHHDDHVHFHCERCDSTFCLDDVSLPEVNTPAGYSISSANLILNGTCNICSK